MKETLWLLIWCLVFNYVFLIMWFLVFKFAHDRIYDLHSRWFRISIETFDTVHYLGMSIYKIGILLFNLVPLIALHFAYR